MCFLALISRKGLVSLWQPGAMNMNTQIVLSKYNFPPEGIGVLRELANSRFGVGKVYKQNPGHLVTESKQAAQDYSGHYKKI